jgi:hypothetical protein
MQATGMVNDHVSSCFRYAELEIPDVTAAEIERFIG